MSEYVKRLIQEDIGFWEDNLHRANAAARGWRAHGKDLDTQYGESGKTLAQIIAGYEDGLAKAKAELAKLGGQ